MRHQIAIRRAHGGDVFKEKLQLMFLGLNVLNHAERLEEQLTPRIIEAFLGGILVSKRGQWR